MSESSSDSGAAGSASSRTKTGDSPERVELQLLFLRHSHAIRAYVLGLVPPQVDADEIVQETFLVAMQKAGEFRSGASFLPWAYGIARLEVLKRVHTGGRAREQALSPELMELLAENAQEVEPVEQQLRALQRCLKRLSPAAYRLLKMFYYEGVTGKAIAEKLGIKAQSVYNSLDRTRARLRACIERELAREGR